MTNSFMKSLSNPIDRLNVQDSTDNTVLYVKGKGYLLRKIDGWRKVKPEFVDCAEAGIGLSQKDAEEQKLFLGWGNLSAQARKRK